MRLEQLARAFADLEGVWLSPYWLVQPRKPLRPVLDESRILHALGPVALHPFAVWAARAGLPVEEIANYQSRCAKAVHRPSWGAVAALEAFSMLARHYDFDSLHLTVLSAIIEAAPLSRGVGRRYAAPLYNPETFMPALVDADIVQDWDAAIRAELAEYFRRCVVAVEVLRGRAVD